MSNQLDIFQGQLNAEEGIKQAIDHADQVCDNWSERAYKALQIFLKYHSGEFMAEDFRVYAEKYIPKPPSDRAYGSIIRRAVNAGIIKFVRIDKVKNPNAHCTPANVWVKCDTSHVQM